MRHSFFINVVATAFFLAACGPSKEEQSLAKLNWSANGFNSQEPIDRLPSEKENLDALKSLRLDVEKAELIAKVDEQITWYEAMIKVDTAIVDADRAIEAKQADKAEQAISSLSDVVADSTMQQLWAKYRLKIEQLRTLRIVVSKSLTLTKTTFSEFKAAHPEANCFDLGETSGCEFKSPSPHDCPAQRPCNTVAYSFGGELGYGFLAHYDRQSWTAWKQEFTAEFGEPEIKRVDATPDVRLSSDIYEWRKGGNLLTLTHFEGVNAYGLPPQYPYGMALTVGAK